MVGLVTAPYTGGSSLADAGRAIFNAATTASILDIFIQQERKEIIAAGKFDEYEAFFNTWDDAYTSIHTADLLMLPTTAAVNGVTKLAKKAKASKWNIFMRGIDDVPLIKEELANGLHAYKVLEEVGETGLKTRVDDIDFVGNYIKSSKKSAKEVVQEILDAGGFLVWKGIKEGYRTLDEILINGKIPPNSKINNKFHKWFNELTLDEFDLVWSSNVYREMLEIRIRYLGRFHEWCMVCETRKFKAWNVPMEEIHRFRTKTLELKGTNPITGEPFAHSVINAEGRVVSGPGSKTFHNELQKIISSSNELEDFNSKLVKLIVRWKINPDLLPLFPTN